MDTAPGFEFYGIAHLVALVFIAAACVYVSTAGLDKDEPRLARGIAFVLLALIVFKPVLYMGVFDEPWGRSLPLALCRINEFICVYMLLARSWRAFEISYFLTIGSVAALLMPDMPVGFPDIRFNLFFLSHGLELLAVVYAMAVFGFRPTLRSVRRVLIFLGLYTLMIAGMNLALDANYLFLREKPAGASVLDYLGPWPLYVVWLIGIAIALCYLCYLPFAFAGRKAPAAETDTQPNSQPRAS